MKNEKTPGQITDANLIKDRVNDNISTSNCIILSESNPRKAKIQRPENPDTWGYKASIVQREAACRPPEEDRIRGIPKKTGHFSAESIPFIEMEVQRRHPNESGKALVQRAIELGILVVV